MHPSGPVIIPFAPPLAMIVVLIEGVAVVRSKTLTVGGEFGVTLVFAGKLAIRNCASPLACVPYACIPRLLDPSPDIGVTTGGLGPLVPVTIAPWPLSHTYMSPLGANAILALGVCGRFVYVVVVGEPVPGPEIRHSAGLSAPPPKQRSSVNRSPLSGSTESALGQVRLDATVATTAPVVGLICITSPVVKPPPVANRLAYSLPPLSTASPVKLSPSEASRVPPLAIPPPDGNLYKFPVGASET